MYALDAAVRSSPTPPHVMVARRTLISLFMRNAWITLFRWDADDVPSRRTHLIPVVISCGWIMSKVVLQPENTTLDGRSQRTQS